MVAAMVDFLFLPSVPVELEKEQGPFFPPILVFSISLNKLQRLLSLDGISTHERCHL